MKAAAYKRSGQCLADFVRQAWSVLEPATELSWNWHIDYLCEWLECITFGLVPLDAAAEQIGLEPGATIERIIINEPPRSTKSLIVSVLWPCWEWIHKPSNRYLCVSFSGELSTSHNLKRRRVIESDWYKEGCRYYWRNDLALTSDQNVKSRFENDHRGHMIAVAMSAATGEGGERVIIDDPLNPTEALSDAYRQAANTKWDETLSSRTNNPGDVFLVIMQRLHEDDFTGHLLSEGGWAHIVIQEVQEETDDIHFPRSGRVIHREGGGVVYSSDGIQIEGDLLWPTRRGVEATKRAAIHRYKFAGQMQQRPRPREGGMFQGHWFEIVDDWPRDARQVRAWDLAATETGQGKDPDKTAGVHLAEKDGIFYVVDLQHFAASPKGVRERVRSTAESDGRRVPIWIAQDPGQAGKDQVASYRTTTLRGFAVHSKPVTGSKVLRADAWNSAAEAGNVKLVRGPWNDAFKAQVERFPEEGHDDIVDAMSDAHTYLTKRSGRRASASYT